jgi:hypothetical protein
MAQQMSNRERQMIAAEREIQSAELRGDTVTADLFRGVLARIVTPKTYWSETLGQFVTIPE